LTLETNRLFIKALKYDELVKYSNGENPFSDWSIGFSLNEIDENLRPVLDNKIIPNVKLNKNNYLFFTIWLMVDKKFNLSVGSLSFKGKPDENGMIEIGYGTHEEFQNKGYMTEAIEAMIRWAFSTGKVKRVIAETAKDNTASFRILEKNGFVKYKENDEFFYWKVDNK